MLIKVRAVAEVRGKIIELADVFRAKILDVGADAMTVEVTGAPEKLQAFEDLVAGYGIIELVKGGRVALARGSKSIKDRTLRVAG
jgi:acetolactate synthase-1/3 small subunit